jgi:hypothetical protein
MPVAPVPPMPRFDGRAPGAHLRACRGMLGLGLNQLHERTRIRHHHLDRIEREDYAQLPPEFYLQADVRQVARALGLPDGARIAECMVLRAREFAKASARPGPFRPPTRGRGESVPSASELVAAVDFEPELDGFVEVDSGASGRETATGTIRAPKACAMEVPARGGDPASAVPKASPGSDSTNATIAALLHREEGVGFATALSHLVARAPGAEAARAVASESEGDRSRSRRGPPTRRRRRRRLRR